MPTTKITTNSLADSAVTSAKLANSISIGTLAVTGNLAVDTNTLFVDAANNRVGVGTTSPSARLHTISTAEQLRVGYDDSNYFSATVDATGAVTLNAVGSGAIFNFSDNVSAANLVYNTGDQSIAGDKTFTDDVIVNGQITSPNQTDTTGDSVLTRSLADNRYCTYIGACLSAGVNSDVNTTTYKSVSSLSFYLGVGNYYMDAILLHNGNASYATSGVKDRITFTGVCTTIGTVYRALDNATTTASMPNGLVSVNPFVESSPSNRSQTTFRKGLINVTSAGVLTVEIAQANAVTGANTTLASGSSLYIVSLKTP
jgi:hypothetical protein